MARKIDILFLWVVLL